MFRGCGGAVARAIRGVADRVGKLGAYAGMVVVVVVGFAAYSHELAALHAEQKRGARTDRRLAAAVRANRGIIRDLERVNEVGTHGSCVRRNALRNGLVGYVGDAIPRSKRTLDATRASPTATADQKFSALVNYTSILTTYRELSHRIPIEKCPPEVKPKGP